MQLLAQLHARALGAVLVGVIFINPHGGAALAQGELRIVEVDYDQPGQDTAEWIEIINWQDTEYFLQGVSVVLYDGSLGGNCAEYCRVDLSPLMFLNAGQRIVIGEHPCAVLPLCASTDAIQNGSPDVIVVETWEGQVIDSLEYEYGGSGACGFATTAAADSETLHGSLVRCESVWAFAPASTPCATNNCD